MIPPVDEEDFEMIQVPETTSSPFRVTRASHLVYTERDLSRRRDFYTEVLGLVVTDEDQEALYLRGVEERSHHSLVLKRTDGAPRAVRTGLRTFDDEDLDRAKAYFERQGLKAEFIETPYQGRTLHAFDRFGTPLEFCSAMPRLERVDQRFETMRRHGAKNADYRGGVTCLYDTQLLGACLHASECGGRSRPGAVRGM